MGSIKVWDYNPDGKNKLTLAMTLRHETGRNLRYRRFSRWIGYLHGWG